jgi:hypothetical protein
MADSAKIRAGFRARCNICREFQISVNIIQDSRTMNRTLLVSAFLAIALTACGKKEPAPAPAAPTPAPVAAPAPAADAAKPADTAAPAAAAPSAPAAAEKKPEEKK